MSSGVSACGHAYTALMSGVEHCCSDILVEATAYTKLTRADLTLQNCCYAATKVKSFNNLEPVNSYCHQLKQLWLSQESINFCLQVHTCRPIKCWCTSEENLEVSVCLTYYGSVSLGTVISRLDKYAIYQLFTCKRT